MQELKVVDQEDEQSTLLFVLEIQSIIVYQKASLKTLLQGGRGENVQAGVYAS